ncbi:MAG: type II toxin-antitoxin system PemK/MazF family toxin [Nodosilinea sp.]
MTAQRGEIWLANLNPTQGSEQAGIRPVIIFQESDLARFTTTVITIPVTSNLRRAALPTCLQISKDKGGLSQTSVALCHQLRVLDQTRLTKRLGRLQSTTISALEVVVLFTLGYSIN